MGLFDKMSEPIIYSLDNSTETHLKNLRELEPLLNEEGQEKIRMEIKCLEAGLFGENNIAFELKNSHMPIYVLQDLFLKQGELTAQIDFLVIARKHQYVIECKNLFGDIEVRNNGDFIRTVQYKGRIKKEGIYSPITQNQRHLDLLKQIKMERQSNAILKLAVEKSFDTFFKSVVVLANPKTVLNMKYAPKAIKEKIIRADQLVSYIKNNEKLSTSSSLSDKQLQEIANKWMDGHCANPIDYLAKYEAYRIKANNETKSSELSKELGLKPVQIASERDVFQALKKFRLLTSRAENIKPYYIFNDAQLNDLVEKNPTTAEELIKVSGFGNVKVEKYGQEILKILKENK